MFVISFGSRLVFGPCVGGSQEVRSAFMSDWFLIPLGFKVLMMASVTKAQAGLDVERSMKSLIQVVSIVLFLALMFSKPIPPSSSGH